MNKEIVEKIKGKSFLKTIDFSKEELNVFIEYAQIMKENKNSDYYLKLLKNKNIALIFEKSSTRTRAAFSVAARDLGANVDYFGKGELHLGYKESIEDTAEVLGRMYDGIEFRGHCHDDVEKLSKFSHIPVWNGLTDEWHPTQMIADFMTIKEVFGTYVGKTLSYIGDGRNNVACDLMVTGAILGVNINIISPEKLFPDPNLTKLAREYATLSGSMINVSSDIDNTITHSDAIYTDVWFSMGEAEKLIEERINLLKPYQVNTSLLEKTKQPDVIVLHCLPAFHNLETEFGKLIDEKYGLKEMEITDEVFKKYQNIIYKQAENRMHSIKAIIALTLGDLTKL
ncbi:ornithine carbamoyltransferase [Macrococcus sp. EM39E]|uniref:ornithine carbamoyltransferase n=1 Tax=Macrococcus animalis TaxID=3395467 RepID=UPI0039BDE6A2